MQIDEGLINRSILALNFNSNGTLFVGTTGNGVSRSVESTTSVNDILMAPSFFRLEQNYPNPFNPTTKIGYTLNRWGSVRLDVYDLLGKHIRTLVAG